MKCPPTVAERSRLSAAQLAQRRAALAARYFNTVRREYATVRIDRRIRDAAEKVLRPRESLASMVGEAVSKLTAARKSDDHQS